MKLCVQRWTDIRIGGDIGTKLILANAMWAKACTDVSVSLCVFAVHVVV